ncbi:guanylate kinase [Mycoplasma iguanae]
MNKKLIIFTGPSGVGKGTIEKLLFKNKDLKLKFSRSATTRKPRIGEKDGIDYFFLDHKTFEDKIANNEFIEWNKHFDNYYGTLHSEIDGILRSGYNAFLEIETTGALNILDFYIKRNKLDNIISIFVMPPSLEELKSRIINRGTENEEQINKRLKKAENEIKIADKFKHKVINENLEQVTEEIKNILNQGLN